jgi:probable DNA metabolism protein
MRASETITVFLPDAVDLTRFRSEARALLQQRIAPECVHWHVADAPEGDLFALPAAAQPSDFGSSNTTNICTSDRASAAAEAAVVSQAASATSTLRVPAFFLDLCRRVILHRDSGRFGLLYRLLWRLAHEPGLRHDPLDVDRIQAEQMARAVRRDMHKMTAFVRFRTMHPQVTDIGSEAVTQNASQAKISQLDSTEKPEHLLHIAWFEPQHHIVAAIAPFFVRRFTGMHWAILTPLASIEWIPTSLAPEATSNHADERRSKEARDITPPAARRRGRLLLGPPAERQDAPPADAGEALWLTYYANIFNPARLKLRMMQKEMPRRYWHNLPEAQLISTLSASAHQRSTQMVEQPASVVRRRLPALIAPATLEAVPPSEKQENLPGSSDTAHAAIDPVPRLVIQLTELKSATDGCRACALGEHATQSVAGEGPDNARLMVVGEQPGDQEDLRGQPFVGPAGKLFDRALKELGWLREALYITNAVKHFKFELRGQRRIHKTPAQQEVAACLQWLEREIELVQPKAVLVLGATAARAVLSRPVAIMKERGQWHTDPRGIPVLITLHPSALLRADPANASQDFALWLEDLSKAGAFAVSVR